MITVSGHDLKGRACSVTYAPRDIHHISVGTAGATIYISKDQADIVVSMREYRRIKPLLSKKTKITGDES